MSYLPSRPDLLNIAGLLALYPRRGVLLFKVLEDIKDSLSLYDSSLCELIIAYISSLNKSEACYNNHKRKSMPLGVDESVFNQLETDIETADVEEKIKAILRLVKKLTKAPEQISQADVNAVFAAGWDERTFLDSICLCAVVNCMTRLATGIGIDKKHPLKQPLAIASSGLISALH
ncbi:hypothetical protein MCAMS1_00420 [biofilm metagenome]